MEQIFNPVLFDVTTVSMAILAVVVFLALQKVEPAYGMTYSAKWGPAVANRIGWIVMECPAFITMGLIWWSSPRNTDPSLCVMASFFMLHYFQRTFVFPMLMRGKNLMPWAIVVMGMLFNTINAYLIGGWLFHISSPERYGLSWLTSPAFILGTLVFFAGMAINIHSDHVIRNLRKPGDTGHYIPMKGLYRHVTAANYFGEFTEWTGFAILTWSAPGMVFALWTFANLAPRAKALHKRYALRFGERFTSLNRKYILPYIY